MVIKAKNKIPEPTSKLNVVQSLTFPLRDVLIESLSRGQFIAAGVLLLLGIFVWRLPEGELFPLVVLILSRIESHGSWGWVSFLATGICWLYHFRFLTRTHYARIKHLQKEKEALQTELLKLVKNNSN